MNFVLMSQKWAFPHFFAASSKFYGKWRIPQCGVKIHMPHNIAGPVDHLDVWLTSNELNKMPRLENY